MTVGGGRGLGFMSQSVEASLTECETCDRASNGRTQAQNVSILDVESLKGGEQDLKVLARLTSV